MLKIKNNVDLKELEKFGFKEEQLFTLYYTREVGLGCECFVDTTTRQIWFSSNGILDMLDIIYNLIQTGLVEEVDA